MYSQMGESPDERQGMMEIMTTHPIALSCQIMKLMQEERLGYFVSFANTTNLQAHEFVGVVPAKSSSL